MKGPSTRFLPALVLWLHGAAVLGGAPAADAQGFSSVSSNSSAAPVTAPSVPPSNTSASAANPSPAASAADSSSAASTAPPPSAAESVPSAQLAALAPRQTPNLGGAGPDTSSPPRPFVQADKVLVDKSDRKLYLLRHGSVVAEYPIKLGLNPYGHKQHEGDFRTPEGSYTLSRRNPRSEFFLALQVSYPNKEDAAWAKENGWSPGGLIMIHGQPNVPKRPADFYANRDWTDGCIALSNSDMVDVWLRTSVGLPIEIRP
jgi:hypothetical protein